MRWDEMRWDESRWDEMRWDEMSLDEMRWDEMSLDEMSLDEMRWDEMRCDEMRWREMWWGEIGWSVVRYDALSCKTKLSDKIHINIITSTKHPARLIQFDSIYCSLILFTLAFDIVYCELSAPIGSPIFLLISTTQSGVSNCPALVPWLNQYSRWLCGSW